jgi:creatinase
MTSQRHRMKYRVHLGNGGLSILSHYYDCEAGLELCKDIETALEPDMMVYMEQMIVLPQSLPGAGGYRENGILVVT